MKTFREVSDKFGVDVAILYTKATITELDSNDIKFAKEAYSESPEDFDVLAPIAGWNPDNTSGAAEWFKKEVEEEFEA